MLVEGSSVSNSSSRAPGAGGPPGAPDRTLYVGNLPYDVTQQEIETLIDERHSCVVTAVPDPSKGERLVAFYTDAALAPQDLWERLCRTELPRLWLPKREDLRVIESIPTLGTGKVDLRAVKQLAIEVEA